MSKIIVLLFLLTKCFAFDLPPGCKNDLTIDKHQYNVTTRYDTGDAVPTDAHYDSKGNLFFVLFGCNYDGFYFDIKVIKPNSSTPQSIPGKLVDLSFFKAGLQSHQTLSYNAAEEVLVTP